MRTFIKSLINICIFWVITDLIPGITFKYSIAGKFIGGIIFALTMLMIPGVLRFFKYRPNTVLRTAAGIVVNFIVWILVHNNTNFILQFGESYIGGGDFIIFTLPKLFIITNIMLVILITSSLLVVCSIILEPFFKN